MDERVMVFIDGSNFYHGMKEQAKRTGRPMTQPDFYKLSKLLTKTRKLIRTYYYTGLHSERDNLDQWRKQQGFLEHLRQTACLAIRTKPLLKRGTVFIEKGIDVLLVVDLIRFARLNSYDTAILISGDGDFVEAVRDVQDTGKQVELAYFPFAVASSLTTICDKKTELTPTLLDLSSTKTLPELTTIKKEPMCPTTLSF